MRLLANATPGQLRRGPLLGAGLLLIFGLLVAYKLAGFIVANDVTSLAFAGMAFAAGAIVMAILNNWRHGVYFFLGWLLCEHFARKYLSNMAIYFAKDILVAASRGVFMWTAGSGLVGAAAFLWGAPWRQGEARRVFRTLGRAALGVALAILALLATYPQALLNRLAVYSETLDPRSPTSELLHRTRDYPLANFMGALNFPRWSYGYGIGAVSLGGQYITRILGAPPATMGVESGFGNIVVEMGIVGLILWMAMSIAVLVCAWKVVRRLKGSPWFPLASMIFWYVFLLLLPFTFVGLQAYEDFVLNAYAWVLLGILFRLPTPALSAQFAAGAPTEQPAGRWIR